MRRSSDNAITCCHGSVRVDSFLSCFRVNPSFAKQSLLNLAKREVFGNSVVMGTGMKHDCLEYNTCHSGK